MLGDERGVAGLVERLLHRWGEPAGLQAGDRIWVPGRGLRLQQAVLASGGAGELFVDTLKNKRARGAWADPKVVQRILGHASAAMTMDLYGHLIDQTSGTRARKLRGTTGAPKAIEAGNDEPPAPESGL